MNFARYLIALIIALPSSLLCMDLGSNSQSPEQILQNYLELAELMIYAQDGDTQRVITGITKNPRLLQLSSNPPRSCSDGSSLTLFTAAARAQHADLVFALIRRNPYINWFEHTELWAELSKKPQTTTARNTLIFLSLARSDCFTKYHGSLKQITDPVQLTNEITTFLTLPRSFWARILTFAKFKIPHIPYVSACTSYIASWIPFYGTAAPNNAHQLLYVVALNNDTHATQIILQNFSQNISDAAYYRAASYACYQDGNPYLAFYILCHRIARDHTHALFAFISPLTDIMKKKSLEYNPPSI